MGVENLKGVIDASEDAHAAAGNVHSEPGDGAGADTESNCTPSGDDTCSRSDGDETRDHALDGADNGGLAEVDQIADDPDEGTHGCADVGVQHSNAGIGRCGVLVAVLA